MNIIIFPWAKFMRNGKPHPKNYPWWSDLIKQLEADGHRLIQVGIEGETQLVSDFRKNLSIAELSHLILENDTWIGLDSFGQHLGWSLGRKGMAIFGQSDPLIFGHHENVNVLKDRSYLRERQFWLWEQAEYREDCWLSPAEIYEIFKQNFIESKQNA